MTTRTKIPVSVEEMRDRLDMRSACWGSLNDVRRAKGFISDWMLAAAYERWPGLRELSVVDVLPGALENAQERRPGFDDLCDEIDRAERTAYRKERPMA